MSHGDNHAKQLVIKQARILTEDLQNGGAGDQHKQGQAVGLLLEMLTPIYEAEFVTVKECGEMHAKQVKVSVPTKIKLGPFQIEGNITAALLMNSFPILCCGGMFFALGKSLGWW